MPRSQIESHRLAARLQVLQGSDVRLGKIGDMNVVADAGAVGSWIIAAVYD